MKYRFLLLLLGITVLGCQPEEDPVQNNDDEGRYERAVFSDIVLDSVEYNPDLGLWMDIYTPEGDAAADRRLIILGHGGAFVAGSRKNPLMIDYATRLAKHGYVVVSYDYRLAGGLNVMLDSLQSLNVVARAMTDATDAINYMISSASSGNDYGIDPTNIALGGNSAGAVLALHVAHFDQNDSVSVGMEQVISNQGGWANQWNPTAEGPIKAVISLAGGIHKPHWLNSYGPALIMAHGTWDPVVPYGCGHVINNTQSATILCGTAELKTKSASINLSHEALIFPEMLHCPWNGDEVISDQVFNFIVPELNAVMK